MPKLTIEQRLERLEAVSVYGWCVARVDKDGVPGFAWWPPDHGEVWVPSEDYWQDWNEECSRRLELFKKGRA